MKDPVLLRTNTHFGGTNSRNEAFGGQSQEEL